MMASNVEIEVRGLDELRARFANSQRRYTTEVERGMRDALSAVWSAVPAYPAPPPNSKYIRTEALGRSLGSGFGGGKQSGGPDIYSISVSFGQAEGRFGSALGYAPYVIGEGTQAAVHVGRWWTFRRLADQSRAAVLKAFQDATDRLARYLEGRG